MTGVQTCALPILAVLEDQGGDLFFGEPALDIGDFFCRDSLDRGVINVLQAQKLYHAAFLRQQDTAQYDVIALIRGGGNGIEALDEIEVLKAVSEMKTPVICAIGHVGEELFMKSIADKVAPTPMA